MVVRPKKHLGQHFLTNQSIAERIVDSLDLNRCDNVLEVGPGTGVLTKILSNLDLNLIVVEIDPHSVRHLIENLIVKENRVLERDFLKLDLSRVFDGQMIVIGNFPYNISSQIFFKVLDHRHQVTQVVCMIQKEVAKRIASPPGSKIYGILSVLLQAYYHVEILFTVSPGSFHPPPKVESAVIRLTRNHRSTLSCDESLFKRIVKQGFQNRRKTLRNALKQINLPESVTPMPILNRRAETLSVEEYEELTNLISQGWNP